MFLIKLLSSLHNYKTKDNFCLYNITQTYFIMNILDKELLFSFGVQYLHWSSIRFKFALKNPILEKALLNKDDSILKEIRI